MGADFGFKLAWLPSRKAIWRPSSSLRKRFIAVSTTVIESLSGSMKSSALVVNEAVVEDVQEEGQKKMQQKVG